MTNIIIEGPEKAGKSTLVEEILTGFEPELSRRIHCVGRDSSNGFGYLHDFFRGLDSAEIQVWDRAWIGEFVYGKLLGDARLFAHDPFAAEWFYGRVMNGRGGKFVLIPEDIRELAKRRDESDLDVDPIQEAKYFKLYAMKWGYEFLFNDYDAASLMTNAVRARKSAFVNVHSVRSTNYVGALRPTVTFVGDTFQEFPFVHRPFYNRVAAEYFRPLTSRISLSQMGFANPEGFGELVEPDRILARKVITVGPKAAFMYPDYPNARYVKGDASIGAVSRFVEDVEHIAEEYGI